MLQSVPCKDSEIDVLRVSSAQKWCHFTCHGSPWATPSLVFTVFTLDFENSWGVPNFDQPPDVEVVDQFCDGHVMVMSSPNIGISATCSLRKVQALNDGAEGGVDSWCVPEFQDGEIPERNIPRARVSVDVADYDWRKMVNESIMRWKHHWNRRQVRLGHDVWQPGHRVSQGVHASTHTRSGDVCRWVNLSTSTTIQFWGPTLTPSLFDSWNLRTLYLEVASHRHRKQEGGNIFKVKKDPAPL